MRVSLVRRYGLALCLFQMTFGFASADQRILIRFERPLPKGTKQSGLSLEPGWTRVDALLSQVGDPQIEHALSVSAKAPRHPSLWRRHGLDRTYRVVVPDSVDVTSLARQLEELPQVVYAEPDVKLRSSATTPNDPLLSQQWYLDQVSDADVDAPEAWDISTGADIIIAVIDSGVDMSHPEFPADKLVPGYDFENDDPVANDQHGHGTAVSSVASATTDNGEGVAGACWNCKIMPLRGDWTAAGADAAVWAADHGAHVINISQHKEEMQ